MAKNYKIFISHSWTYHDSLTRLRNLLNERGYFNAEFLEAGRDEPINSGNISYIRQALKKRVCGADIVIAIAGVYATRSEWIALELEAASLNNIPVIGVIPFGQERISSTVQTYAAEIVHWNTESVVRAIRKNALI